MSHSKAVYTQAILTILDSISPDQTKLLKEDIKLKMRRIYELQPVEIAAYEALETLIKVSEQSRLISDD